MFEGIIRIIEDRGCEKSMNFFRDLLDDSDFCPQALKAYLPDPLPTRFYDRRVLFTRCDIEAVLATWPPGVFTLPHNHGIHPTFGVVKVLTGTIENRIFAPDQNRIRPAGISHFQAGDILKVPLKLIHAMGNPHSEIAVSLHIYSPKIEQVSYWDPLSFEPLRDPQHNSGPIQWPTSYAS
ncbi:MAG: cysteine dioxygenase family protein [Acidobacteria bacterium]|nr:cysteine dioxygenase family protein [Acidobacteriota bacterium]MCB9399615.1 cysteine dioxygenase family protein [Acidobacteriota bacterium]